MSPPLLAHGAPSTYEVGEDTSVTKFLLKSPKVKEDAADSTVGLVAALPATFKGYMFSISCKITPNLH